MIYHVIGLWWYNRSTPLCGKSFQGVINTEEGRVSGCVEDVHGFANIEGQMDERNPTFTKTYDHSTGRGGAIFPLSYQLQNTGHGYLGTFSYSSKEGQRGDGPHGKALCVLALCE